MRLASAPGAPRAALVVVAHRRDVHGARIAGLPVADGDALSLALGTGVVAGLRPSLVVAAPGDPIPLLADRRIDVDPAASDADVLEAVRRALAQDEAVPARVVVVPVEQPLASATQLWSLVAESERRVCGALAAGHQGVAGQPRVYRFDRLVAGERPEILEGSATALFWLPDAGAEAAQRLLTATPVQRDRLQAEEPSRSDEDLVATEEPLELRLGGEPVVVMMRTPGHDADLARGFLVTEGIVRRPEEIQGLRVLGNRVEVDVAPAVLARRVWTRNFYASSSCGVCGKSSIDEIVLRFPKVSSDLRIPRSVLFGLPARLGAAQAVFSRTGGLHASGLFSEAGELLQIREDVGRHNALDKIVGHAAARGALPLGRHVLVVSGRVSFEIVQKAIAAGLPIIAAVSAPSSLAVSLAAQHGVTVVGFLRGETANVYTHPERIVD